LAGSKPHKEDKLNAMAYLFYLFTNYYCSSCISSSFINEHGMVWHGLCGKLIHFCHQSVCRLKFGGFPPTLRAL